MVSILVCFVAVFWFHDRTRSSGLEQRGSYYDMSDCTGNIDIPSFWEVGPLTLFFFSFLLFFFFLGTIKIYSILNDRKVSLLELIPKTLK